MNSPRVHVPAPRPVHNESAVDVETHEGPRHEPGSGGVEGANHHVGRSRRIGEGPENVEHGTHRQRTADRAHGTIAGWK